MDINDIKNLIFKSTLYSKWDNDIQFEAEKGILSENKLDELISDFRHKVEHYCTECRSKRIFAPDKGIYDSKNVINSHFGTQQLVENKPTLFKTFRCSANSRHQILFGFHLNESILIKIAEYPSKYDSVIGDFNKYKKILKKGKLNELAKASQLESFGYAIASFLHYRRIFETLILTTYNESDIADKIDKDQFCALRINDKIKYVKNYLPDYFNENSHIYGILSKGVHELNEKECQDYLPIVKAVIFFALDEAVDKRNEKLRKIEFSKKLKDINSKL